MRRLPTIWALSAALLALAIGEGVAAQESPPSADGATASPQAKRRAERERKRLERKQQQIEDRLRQVSGEPDVVEIAPGPVAGNAPGNAASGNQASAASTASPDAGTPEAAEPRPAGTIKFRWGQRHDLDCGCCGGPKPEAAAPEAAVPVPEEEAEASSPDNVDFRFGVEAIMFPVWGPYFTMGLQLYKQHLIWMEGGVGFDQYYNVAFGGGFAYLYRLEIATNLFSLFFGGNIGYWYAQSHYYDEGYYDPYNENENDGELTDSAFYVIGPILGATLGDLGDVFGVDLFFRMPIGDGVLPIISLGMHVTL